MIFEGVKLMFVGMGTVFTFLWVTVLCIQLVSRLTSKHAARELENIEQERQKVSLARKDKMAQEQKTASAQAPNENEDDIAAIAAAIASFEADRLRSC
jgi:sodium pump decarboxylase gamma subunit